VGVAAAEQVEERRTRPRTDREVGQQRVQRVAERDAAEEILDRPGPEQPADLLGDRFGGAVEGRELADPVGELTEAGIALAGHGTRSTRRGGAAMRAYPKNTSAVS